MPSGASLLEPTIRLVPPGDVLGPEGTLSFSELTKTRSIVDRTVKLDLSFVAKQVRLPTAVLPSDVASESPIGGMPIVDSPIVSATNGINWALPDTSVMDSESGSETVPGIPGLLGRLAGTVDVPVEEVTEALTPRTVTVEVRWQVYDNDTKGHASDVEYRIVQAAEPGDYQPLPDPVHVAPTSTPGLLGLRFPVRFSELRSATPEVRSLAVQASIQLAVSIGNNAVQTSWIDLPALPLAIPTVPIPIVLVLFEHKDFSGRAFVDVPSGSLVGAASHVPGAISLAAAFQLTSSVLGSVLPNHPLVLFLQSGAGQQLAKLVPTAAQVIFAAQSRIDNLATDDYAFNVGTVGVGRVTVEDIMSSVICIGPQNTVVDLHATRDNPPDVTPLQVELRDRLGIAIKNLNTLDPKAEVTFGGEITKVRPNTNFNDKISSLFIKPA
jgi:hypothetical protein